jgi:SAM-dependent methyltransferase
VDAGEYALMDAAEGGMWWYRSLHERLCAALAGITGPVLDAGCGTGEHALMAAALGHPATGFDLAGNALETARRKAGERGLDARFLRQDALRLAEKGELAGSGEYFDTVLDCGLLHTFSAADRAVYLSGLRTLMPAGARCLILAFSDRQPGDFGRPHKFARAELEEAFSAEAGWRLDSLEPSTIDVTIDPSAVSAWLVQATRL